MNILVLGGSYFLGKHFVSKIYKEQNVTVFNRGTKPLGLPGVSEVKGDRRTEEAYVPLKGKHFDAVVDFCAYAKGDIEWVFRELDGGFDQYIFISTCDVYERGRNVYLDESAPFEVREFGGEVGDYITGKVSLEEELKECSMRQDVKYTSLRPAFIYGPDNYAPREGIYFQWIAKAGQILHPQDADGEFQMVYVEDVALAVKACLGNPAAYKESFNLAPDCMITYASFADALAKSIPVSFQLVPVTVRMVNEEQIPLPFPLTHAESNWYDGRKALALIGQYTSLEDGLAETAKKAGCF